MLRWRWSICQFIRLLDRVLRLVTLLTSPLRAQYFTMSSPSSLNRARHLIITFACCPLFLDYLYFPLLISYLLFLHLLSLFSSFFFSYPFFSFLYSFTLSFLLVPSYFFTFLPSSTGVHWLWMEVEAWPLALYMEQNRNSKMILWQHLLNLDTPNIWNLSTIKVSTVSTALFFYLRWVCVTTFSLHRNFYASGISKKNDFQSVKNIMRTFLLTL